MIVVRLIGGLGNQMFQYAMGRAIADRLQVSLKLDTTAFRNDTKRRYELWALNIVEELASDAEISDAHSATQSRLHLRETGLGFDSNALQAPDGAYVDGYWGSEQYFASIEERIRAEFSFRGDLRGKDLDIVEQMREGDSISLHVRRGDMANDPHTRNFHGLCTEEYYASCVEHMAKQLEHPRFFVFSDDPEWVRNNLSLGYPMTVIDHNAGSRSYADMRLMSMCRHHIIANSTFSWWGAWLNPSADKIVLMPRRWLSEYTTDDLDVRPPTWVAL